MGASMEWIAETLKSVSGISTPLAFWSLVGILTTWVAITLIRNPRVVEIFVGATKDGTSARNFFRLMRLLLFGVFATLWLALGLAVVAPLASDYISKHRSDTSLIIDTIELDEKISEALELYKENDAERAGLTLEEARADPRIAAKLDGLVVNSYFASGDYKKCAIAVLARSKFSRDPDNQLWSDAWLCLRRYALSYSEMRALKLISELQRNDPKQIISKLWAFLPANMSLSLRAGLHRHVIEDQHKNHGQYEGIKLILEENPDEPYAAFGYYAIGEYETALRSKGKELIEPVLLFAIAEELATPTMPSIEELQRATTALTEIINAHSDSPLTDDAALLLARLHSSDPKRALQILKGAGKLGDSDKAGSIYAEIKDLFEQLSLPERETLLTTDSVYGKDFQLWVRLATPIFRSGDYPYAERIALKALTTLGFDIQVLGQSVGALSDEDMEILHLKEANFVPPNGKIHDIDTFDAYWDSVTPAGSSNESDFDFDSYWRREATWSLVYIALASREVEALDNDKQLAFKPRDYYAIAFKYREIIGDRRTAIRLYNRGLEINEDDRTWGMLSYGKMIALASQANRSASYATSALIDDSEARVAMQYALRLVDQAKETANLAISPESFAGLDISDDIAAEYVCMVSDMFVQLFGFFHEVKFIEEHPSDEYEDDYGSSEGNDGKQNVESPAFKSAEIASDLSILEDEIVRVLNVLLRSFSERNAVDNGLYCWANALNAIGAAEDALKMYSYVTTYYANTRIGKLVAKEVSRKGFATDKVQADEPQE